VVVAILLMLLGYVAAGVLARFLGRIVRRRSKVAEGGAKAIESLAFYALVTFVVLLSLDYVNIPLTAFTLLGGALAVGIGFGSQTIVSNFISGLILLTERPIQVGDIVEIDGTQGTVDRIGPRSTRIRTLDNIHLIVPNSTFLEKNVVNWTMSDNTVRSMVQVGVQYGSDTREVTKVLRRVMDEHGQILEEPEPIVLFHDFADSALVFRAFFWVQMRDVTQRGRIASDVRYRIDRLFAEAGIVMAYPQRDVHLDAARPLEVRLVEREAAAAAASARADGDARARAPEGAKRAPSRARSPDDDEEVVRGADEGDGVGP
jgi:small-conductance mechanosensitive channel